MKSKFLLCGLMMALFTIGMFSQEQVEKERSEFLNLIKMNPNYFGTMVKAKMPPVKVFSFSTAYEEACNIGYYPKDDTLAAVIKVKKAFGYSGTLCKKGSIEYVRFFVDWNGNGKFNDPSESVGFTGVNVHDIPTSVNTCIDTLKPISYSVSLKLNPVLHKCSAPYLVKVRTILSWNHEPDANNPDYRPVYGNVIDRWIQIRPLPIFMLKPGEIEKIEILPKDELVELYKPFDVPLHRIDFNAAHEVAQKIKIKPELKKDFEKDSKLLAKINLAKIIMAMKYNTVYEQLTCVGLDNDFALETLKATLTIKKPYGYLGNLCKGGSTEYVGFWAYVKQNPLARCEWKYLGTGSVKVHDIKNTPVDGLQYSVKLPYDFSAFRASCDKPILIKIRAILSWNVPPDSRDPEDIPSWGNKIDSVVQLRPGDPDPETQKPFITLAGGIAVNCIAGNSNTEAPIVGSIDDGYANNGLTAFESPFGQWVSIGGRISNAPNYVDSTGVNPNLKLKYRVQFRKIGESGWQDLINTYRVHISKPDGTVTSKKQEYIDGYYTYEPNPALDWQVEASDRSGGCILGEWYTPSAYGDGLYEIRLLMKKSGAAGGADIPEGHIASEAIKIIVDNTPPTALLSLNAGNCVTIQAGETGGLFTATDKHFYKYSLDVHPSGGGVIAPTIGLPSETWPALAAPGRDNYAYTLTVTDSTTPCGYVVHLYVWDRAILNNGFTGNQAEKYVGLCVKE